MLIPKTNPFASLSRATAVQLISTPDDNAEEVKLNRELYNGNHWMDGDGWIGPIPATNDGSYADVKAEIAKAFCSRNVVKEVTDRKVDGLLKRDPNRTFTTNREVTKEEPLTDAEEKLVSEARRLHNKWWTQRKCLKLLKEAHGRAQIGERVVLRLYVPRGLLERGLDGKGRIPTGKTIEDYLDIIHVHVSQPGQAGVHTDPDTKLPVAVYDEAEEGKRHTEIVYLDGEDTVIRTISNYTIGGEAAPDSLPESAAPENGVTDDEGFEIRLKMGGKLTMFEPEFRSIISQQVRENQMAINLAKTMQNRNTVTAGFLERIILDAMPPGKWIQDPETPGREIYEVGPFKVGGGTTNFFMAAEYRDSTGEKRFGNPSVHFREPSSSEVFTAAKRDCYQDILEEVGQPHLLISGDATASGKSREMAREIFLGTLEDDEGEARPLIEWLMIAPLMMAAYFSNQPTYFDTLVPQAQCYLNSGALSDGERQANQTAVEKGMLSRQTAMSRDGIKDPKAELNLIEEEVEGSVEAKTAMATLAQALTSAGSNFKGAAKEAGFDEESIEDMAQTDFVEEDANGNPTNPAAANSGQRQRAAQDRRGAGGNDQSRGNAQPPASGERRVAQRRTS